MVKWKNIMWTVVPTYLIEFPVPRGGSCDEGI
jgi:hypothetical protein